MATILIANPTHLRYTKNNPAQHRKPYSHEPPSYDSHYDYKVKLLTYSVMLPLFMEANVMEKLITNIIALEYPKDLLQILIILEESDIITQTAVKKICLPAHFHIVIVPRADVQTKGGACNYALQFASGEYCVIYDAEDKPDSDQLIKATEKFATLNENYVCLQAKLTYYNWDENYISKMFAIEYSILFDYLLPALTKLGFPTPLGGSSNHFKTKVLKEVGGWNPYNVTEDAELGMRLKLHNFKVDILDSYTFEEAPIHFKIWLNQRTRWIKGHLITYLDCIYNFCEIFRSLRLMDFIPLSYTVGLSAISSFSTPILCLGILLRPEIQDATLALLVINLLFLYSTTAMLAKATQYNRKLKIKTSLWMIFPIYFILHMIASVLTIPPLYRSPLFWCKTPHGLSKMIKK